MGMLLECFLFFYIFFINEFNFFDCWLVIFIYIYGDRDRDRDKMGSYLILIFWFYDIICNI